MQTALTLSVRCKVPKYNNSPVTTGTLKKKEISEAAAEMSTEKKQIQVSNTPPSLRPSPVVASSSSSTIRAENSAIIPSLVVPSDMKIMDASVAAPRTETTTSSVQSLTPTPSSPLASLSTQQELHVKKNPNEQQKEHLVTTPQNKIQIVEEHQVSQQQQQLQQSTTRTTTEHPQTRSEIESTKSVNSTKVTKEQEPQHSLKSSSMEPPISSKNSNNQHKDTPPSPNNQEQTSEKSATTLSVKPIKEEEHGNDEKEENEQDLNQEEEDESVDHDSELNSSSNDDDNDEQDTTEHPKDDDNDDDEEEEVDQPEEVTEPHTTLDSKTFIHQQDDLQSLKKALQQVLQKNEPSLSSRKKNKTKQQDQHETQSSPQQQLQQPQQQQVENKVSEQFVTSSNHEESLTPQHAHHHLRKTLSAATNSESTMTTITPTTTTTTPTTSETSTKNNPLQFNTSTSTTSTTTTTTKNSTTNTENMMEQTQPPPRITRGPTSLYPTPDLGHPPHSIIPIKTPRQSFHMKPENFQCTWKDTHQVFLSQYHAIWGSGIPLRLFYRLWNAFIEYSIFKTDKLYFLGVLIRDLRKPHERSIMPCSDRITRIDNVGQNGEKNGEVRYWEISADFCEYYQEKERSEGISHKRQYVFVPS
ncbi:hypothetical protein C9374_003578 [Naegleria lovaniensis]|uniref:Uncharacterized protein n=1 Tax=Naegleria lovaniensis TaxID=51637 RepID=A0AA88H5E3_NAELO|nr:uncharacterized protein C9374_003578 [Naegleria lovaniensis]KAG2393814.1 hypothetical protein C9374_003578 [Naegleria lovaniensis]